MSNAVLTENEERLFGAAKEAEAEATQETKKQDVEELKKKYTRTLSLCPPPFALFFHRTAVNCAKQEVMRMKHRWTTLLWELWAAQALCAVAALPPGSAFHTCPALALPGLALAAAVPTAWAAWALLAEPPDGLPPEQLLEQAPGFDFATLCDFERPAAVP